MFHIHCGDTSADALRASGCSGSVVVWTDLLWSGPLREGISDDEYIRDRCVHLSAATGGARTPAQCEDHLRRQDGYLRECTGQEDVVLWFDACMYDQLILMRLLSWFHSHGSPLRLWLICVGQHAAIPGFRGLGELSSEQLFGLLPDRRPVSFDELVLAERVWRALCRRSPLGVQQLIHEDTSVFPYLRDALERFLQEFPAVETGLSRLQREVLSVAVAGFRHPVSVFCAVSDLEARPFFGDTSLWQVVNGLSGCECPALRVMGPGALPLWGDADLNQWRIEPTEHAREYLAGRRDYLEANGVDRWLGGVHLAGRRSAWRWDRAGRCIERVDAASCTVPYGEREASRPPTETSALGRGGSCPE